MAIEKRQRNANTWGQYLGHEHMTTGDTAASNQIQSSNVKRAIQLVDRSRRERRNGHKGSVIWLTGLSGAGKSTLASETERQLFDRSYQTYMLDGDNLRHGLNSDLAFSPHDRTENIRRAGEVSALIADAGLIVICAFISPYQNDRDRARKAASASFHEIYVKASLATCEERDPKGLYRLARAGSIKDFTGISAPYEPPVAPDLVIDTQAYSVEACVTQLVDYIVASCGT